jgi:hypothetical protein
VGVKPCRDCPPGSKRKAPHPGPRCATHHREFLAIQALKRHDVYVGKTYGLQPGQYAEILEAQGGRCYICQRATGKTRRLAVDHDHKTGFVRGLLCKPCNRMLGHLRDDITLAQRIASYLSAPPAQRLGIWAKPEEPTK